MTKGEKFRWLRNKYSIFFELDALPRSASSLLGIAIFMLQLSSLERNVFVELQVYMGLAGLILWISDLGLVNRSLIYFHSGNKGLAKYLIILRILSFLFFGAFIGVISLGISNSLNIFLFFGVMLDLITDSLTILRAVISPSNFPNLFLVFKKSCILVVLSFLFAVHRTVTGDSLGLILIISSLIIILNDSIFWAKITMCVSHKVYKESLLSWLQNGGVTIAGLDVIFISKLYPEIVAIFSFVRKCSNVLGINAGRMTQKILTIELDQISRFIVKNFVIIAPYQSFLFFVTYFFNDHFANLYLNQIGIASLLIMILLLPVGFNTSLINLRFQKIGLFRELILINWVTSVLYLTFVLLGLQEKNPYLFLIGVVFNQMLELLSLVYILKKFRKQKL